VIHHQLAQVNIARLVAPLDSPRLSGFVSRLDDINALADAMPGFVWRLQTPEGDATALRPYDDDRILVNMSVWESLEALQDYVYRTPHAEVMRQRREWFEKMTEAFVALWWIPVDHRPTVAEARERLEHLRAHGPTSRAFTFRQPCPSPSAPSAQPRLLLPDECPAG
jgi:heme-degrading monooxygenase HmoA